MFCMKLRKEKKTQHNLTSNGIGEMRGHQIWGNSLKTWHKQAVCPHDKESWLLGLHQEKQFQQVKWSDLDLCSAMLRPYLDFLIHVQASQYRRDLDILEGVQTRAMKMIRGLDYLAYEEVLKQLGLFSLEKEGTRRGKKKTHIKGSWMLYKEYGS